jgi:hypothetical protein
MAILHIDVAYLGSYIYIFALFSHSIVEGVLFDKYMYILWFNIL